MKKNKNNEIEFIVGVKQAIYVKDLKLDSTKNNFIYQNHLDAKNWQEHYNNLQLQEKIDLYIKNSRFKSFYKDLNYIFKPEDGIEIYFLLKNKLKNELMISSNIFIFVNIMDILNININKVIKVMPYDEKLLFNEELKNKEIISKKSTNDKELF